MSVKQVKRALKTRLKTFVAFIVAFIAALVAELQSGSTFDDKTLLLALGTAIVTAFGVHQVPNL